MGTSKIDFFKVLQEKLPQAKIQWEGEPDPRLDNQFCSISATCIADPSKKFTMKFDYGLNSPPLDDVIETFVEMFIHDTSCR